MRADFRELAGSEQLRLADETGKVVPATDSAACQRRVNELCNATANPPVYPRVWVNPRVDDAEVGEPGEIL